jgi:hypothetical protein
MRAKNREQIVALYQSGLTPGQVAAEVGCHRQTVYNHLYAAGVEMRDCRSNPPTQPRREFCGRGVHRLTDDAGEDTENVKYDKRGRRYCNPCAIFRWALRDEMKRQPR